ncbi:MAG TPA: LuxR C-terminal-related transcriptional regulator [Clostridia bacterium]|nr:LuxR C-terminal-related transcriptional regulator [Clostridia bacterium]
MNLSSDTLLLSTKLKVPVPRRNYVVRRVLFEKLSQCGDMGVVFVRGGAGTGKTTLLSSFIREKGLKNVCWLSVDATNSNVYSFWLYFTAAVSAFWDDDDSFLTLMRSNPDAAHMENLLIMLINRLCGEEDYYMVLDDVHCINDAALIKTFEFFIGNMPSNFHFIMLSREDPPVYLGPLAVSGRLLFIDGKQMLLSPEEGKEFLKNTLSLAGSDEELDRINTYAEGWIGGLQLAAAAGAVGKSFGQMLSSGGGIAAEYLTREVFESLSEAEKDFLIKTGFLSYFDTEICTRLLDNFTKIDFEQMIDTLIRKNLFIICIDEQNGVYRYHNILSEYISQKFLCLPEQNKKELYIKTAGIFEELDDYEEALRNYCAAEDYEDVIRVAKAMGGRIESWSYLDKVPVERLILDADLSAQCFMYNLGNLNIEHCRILFEKFREHYGDSDIFHVMQFAEAYVSKNGGILPQYQALTAEQIEHLHFGPVAKAIILVQNSAALVERMQYEEAEDCIKLGIQMCAGANIFVDFFAYNQLAQIYEDTGRLNDSLSCYAKSKELFKNPSMMMGIGTNYYFGIAGVYMRRMELDKAEEVLEQSRQLLAAKHISVDIADITLSYHLAEMKFLHGDDDAGAAFVEEILSEYSSFSVLTLGRLLHELDCAGRLSPKLADDFLKELEIAKNYRMQPFMRLLRTRIIFKLGQTEEAFKEIEEILTFFRAQKNKLHLVEAGLLKIFMLQNCKEQIGRQREINNLLREAIYYAHEDRILMPFYLERSTLLPLLNELFKKATGKDSMTSSEAAFVRDIIAVCSNSASAIKNEQELLSVRELEVLEELALGITNREIAEKLCISQATVKTHVLSIFGKLEVSSRMLAVDKGRKLGLIK